MLHLTHQPTHTTTTSSIVTRAPCTAHRNSVASRRHVPTGPTDELGEGRYELDAI